MMGNAMWHLIMQSDAVSKGVMLLLLIMSVICWTIFLYKIILFRIKSKQLQQSIRVLSSIDSFEKLLEEISALRGTIPGYFLSKNVHFLKSLLSQEHHRVLSEEQLELIEQNVDQAINDLVHIEEKYVPFLSTCAAVAPLLGLFGTVWGLVHSFIRISEQQTADIATVAPGIAEALMTTLAGLMVAIPAVVMFNVLSSNVRYLEQKLLKLASYFMTQVQRQFRRVDAPEFGFNELNESKYVSPR